MHLRISTKKSKGRLYQYVQIVESYRRDDGVPAHRTIANLGQLTDQEISNLRVALQASRQGTALVLPEDSVRQEWRARIMASLSYLDVAVALEIWNRWKLPGLFDRLLPQGNEAVPPGAVVAALVLHRCTDPGSKLYAQRWFPRTALPELLNIEPSQFGNSRIHRTLESLDRIDQVLQQELVQRYRSKDGMFAAVFIDVTDAWFAGRGPELAQRNRTKDGLSNRHKIGIVLICNEHGYPVRWQVVPGKRRDHLCIADMLEDIQGADWIGDTPLVCDRAMGRAMSVAKLVNSGLRFVTAVTRSEINAYTDGVPCEPFLDLSPIAAEATLQNEIAVAARTAEQAGMQKVDDMLYICDLGICERTLLFERPLLQPSGACWNPDALEGAASIIALARIFDDQLHKQEYQNKDELAQKNGLTKARVTQILNTLKLDPLLQEQILAGNFGYVSERLLHQCIRIAEPKQRVLLEQNAQIMRPARQPGLPPRRVGRQTVSLRLVAYFNPRMFVEHRGNLAAQRRRIESFVDALNDSLRNTKMARDKQHIRNAVHRELARWTMLSLFDVQVRSVYDRQRDCNYWRVRLTLDQDKWQRRIGYAGFVLLVAHPDMPHSAEDIVRLYRQKDTVEKDFQTIKSVVKLRPIFHHTDAKVRAHVTLCMLALLIERSIEHRLSRAKMTSLRSAVACFEELRGCRLNLVLSDQAIDPIYTATEPTQEQRAILQSLRMSALICPEEISESIKLRRK